MTTDDDDWTWVDEDTWVPPRVDTSKPSIARIYDYALGGKDNFPIDREVAERTLAVAPDGRAVGLANRRFLVEAVRAMTMDGISQFIDLGTGIPTAPNVHETVWTIRPEAKIVYVDNDPIVLAHNRALLRAERRVVVSAHDLRDPAAVLGDPRVQQLIDFSRPVGLLMLFVVHFVDLATAPNITFRYLRALAPGSQLALSTVSSDGLDPGLALRTQQAYGRDGAPALVYRTKAEIEALFDGLEMIYPVADVYRSSTAAALGGIGRKP